MKCLGIIDMQNDFVNPKGSLYVPGAEKVRLEIEDLFFRGDFAHRFNTMDRHNGEEAEMKANGGPFPLHCMYGTWGEDLIYPSNKITASFSKRCYNVFDGYHGNPYIRMWLKQNYISRVVLCGVVGNICVEACALGLRKLCIDVDIVNDAVVWLHVDDNNNEEVSRKKLLDAGVKFI